MDSHSLKKWMDGWMFTISLFSYVWKRTEKELAHVNLYLYEEAKQPRKRRIGRGKN